jgi:hypothetical protein
MGGTGGWKRGARHFLGLHFCSIGALGEYDGMEISRCLTDQLGHVVWCPLQGFFIYFSIQGAGSSASAWRRRLVTVKVISVSNIAIQK